MEQLGMDYIEDLVVQSVRRQQNVGRGGNHFGHVQELGSEEL